VIYEMATGKAPFAALLTKDPSPVNAVREQEGRPPLPAGFDGIVTGVARGFPSLCPEGCRA
jgi:hypothetical protein